MSQVRSKEDSLLWSEQNRSLDSGFEPLTFLRRAVRCPGRRARPERLQGDIKLPPWTPEQAPQTFRKKRQRVCLVYTHTNEEQKDAKLTTKTKVDSFSFCFMGGQSATKKVLNAMQWYGFVMYTTMEGGDTRRLQAFNIHQRWFFLWERPICNGSWHQGKNILK